MKTARAVNKEEQKQEPEDNSKPSNMVRCR